MTIRAGRIVYDLNGIATPIFVTRRRNNWFKIIPAWWNDLDFLYL